MGGPAIAHIDCPYGEWRESNMVLKFRTCDGKVVPGPIAFRKIYNYSAKVLFG